MTHISLNKNTAKYNGIKPSEELQNNRLMLPSKNRNLNFSKTNENKTWHNTIHQHTLN